jgi:hypothetical protein
MKLGWRDCLNERTMDIRHLQQHKIPVECGVVPLFTYAIFWGRPIISDTWFLAKMKTHTQKFKIIIQFTLLVPDIVAETPNHAQ